MAQYNIPTFEGRPDEDVHEWLAAARAEFERHGVLHAQWVPIAKKFLRRGFVLEELRNNTKLQEAIVNEEWDSFTHALLYGRRFSVFILRSHNPDFSKQVRRIQM
jgi:hypothetical protein